ncbi:MAG: GIDE domain-containing protein [Candidatus ainarchaeum sp.]|nr:GIDE domain-containing protein [Candidatus ainarchaeum sp.]
MVVPIPQCCCIGGFCLFFGLLLIYNGTQRRLLIQRIKNTPTSKVRSAAAGLVELFGKAVCKDGMDSPVSQRRCAFWRIHGEYYQPGKHGGWRTILRKDSSTPFYLEDETGKMLIDPKGAEVDIPQDFQSTGHLSEKGFFGLLPQRQLHPNVLALMERDQEIGNKFRSRSSYNLRITEYFIAEGDPLYVFGNAVLLEGASSHVAHENLTVKKPKGAPMYISDSHEKRAIDKLNTSMAVQLAIGLALTAIGLFMLLTVFLGDLNA